MKVPSLLSLCSKLSFVALALAVPAFADTPIASYQLQGSLTFTSAAACPTSPCTEVIDFTLDIGYFQTVSILTGGDPGYIAKIVGTPSISSTGPLGPFTSAHLNVDNDPFGFLAFFDGGDEADLGLFNLVDFPLPTSAGPPEPGNADLFACTTAACQLDFGFNPGDSLQIPGDANVTVRQIPEPGILISLAAGMPLLILLARLALAHRGA